MTKVLKRAQPIKNEYFTGLFTGFYVDTCYVIMMICHDDVIEKFKKDNNLLRFISLMSSNVKLVNNEVTRNQDKPLGVRFSSTRWRSNRKKVK